MTQVLTLLVAMIPLSVILAVIGIIALSTSAIHSACPAVVLLIFSLAGIVAMINFFKKWKPLKIKKDKYNEERRIN